MLGRQPELKGVPFVLALPAKGSLVITEVSAVAKAKVLYGGMIVVDAKVTLPEVQVYDDKVDLADKLFKKLCI